MKKILLLGAGGQIGSELTTYLRKIYGANNVVATDLDIAKLQTLDIDGPTERLDALDDKKYAELVSKYNIDTIYNLVAVLSATGEKNPGMAMQINMGALVNSLRIAREKNCAVFTPSSIGAFGTSTPHKNTPQDTVMRPTTIYGVCKVSGELLSDYYYHKFGVDTRSVRFPGIISYVTLPGGGTTDYAVEIYYEAIKNKSYTSNLPAGTYLDMMYMPDALKACVDLMEADPAKLVHRNSFNIAAMSFDPEEIAASIRKRIPEFTLSYDVDPVKKQIADTWPDNMDDSCAREEWGWKPEFDLEKMTDDMLAKLKVKFEKGLF